MGDGAVRRGAVHELDHRRRDPGGIARLPDGRRKQRFRSRFDDVLVAFSDRVLAFDVDAAREYAEIASSREGEGRAIDVPDAQIAAVCRLHDATLATRNVGDFVDVGIEVVNPLDLDD